MGSLVKCELCGGYFTAICWAHLHYLHGITTYEYRSKFPTSNMVSEEVKKKIIGSMLSEESKLKSIETRRRRLKEMPLSERQAWVARSCGTEDSIRRRTESIRKFHHEMSQEDRRRWVAQSFHSLTPEQEKQKALKISRSLSAYWTSMSPEDLQSWSHMRSIIQKKHWDSLTPQELDKIRKNFSQVQKLRFENMASEDLRHWGRTHRLVPSGLERILMVYLDRRFPTIWKYNGDGSQGTRFGRRVPDFIRADGTKEVVEVLGGLGYFHFLDDEEELRIHYRKYGVRCIVVWEWDCYIPGELDRIFNGKGEQRAP